MDTDDFFEDTAVTAPVLTDDEDDIWDAPPADEDAIDKEAAAAELLAKPIGETFSAIALQGVSTKQKKKSLAAQSNEWLSQTFARLSGLLTENPTATEVPDWNEDIRALQLAADVRAVTLELALIPAAPKAESTEVVRLEPDPASAAGAVVAIDLREIEPDPTQARDEGADDELAASIKANGVLQPIRIYKHPGRPGRYVIDDGERRYRGSIRAGSHRIPAIIVAAPASEGDKLIRQVSSNDGKRLKPMEEARTFKRIMADKGWTIQQLADALGKSKSTVSDRVALADVPAPFLEYFEKGHLTAAAAPIVRQLADVPAKALERIAQNFSENWNVEDAINDGKPIPLRAAEQAVDEALGEEMREIAAVLAPEYSGKVVLVGKRKFAVDVAAYDALEKKRQSAKTKDAPAPVKAAPDPYRAKQLAEQKKAREKSELRRLQIVALSGKLPTSLGGSANQSSAWSMFLVRYFVREMTHDTQRSACKLLNLEPPTAGTHQGYQFDKAILKHAEALKAPERVRLALQLLLAHDMYCSPNFHGGGDRIAEAAKLTGVDLKQVVVPDAKKPTFAKVPVPKGRRPAFMAPMQPSAQLAAIVGEKPLPKTEVAKRLWAYIKKHGLQDAKERRMINTDALMKPVLGGKKRVSMFEMTKLVNKHLR